MCVGVLLIFSKEFWAAANELELAAKESTNPDFNEFLKLQAKALRENNLQNGFSPSFFELTHLTHL